MFRKFTIVLFALLLNGCGVISNYKPTIEQGNIYTSEDIKRLKIGMTKAQCAYILGNSVLDSTFINNRWDYVYILKPRGQNHTYKKYLVLFFDNDEKLVEMIRSDTPPEAQS